MTVAGVPVPLRGSLPDRVARQIYGGTDTGERPPVGAPVNRKVGPVSDRRGQGGRRAR